MYISDKRHYDLFDLLRIIAAVGVVYFHSYPLTGHGYPLAPLLSRADVSYADLAVGAFFALSGFLVVASWSRSSSLTEYVRNRVVRIWPGFLVMVTLATFVVGPLVSTLSVRSYLRNDQTISYWFHTSLLDHLHGLPGVFATNPFPNFVNGSIWTIRYEVLAYVGVLCLGLLGVLRHKHLVLVVTAGLGILFVLVLDTHVLEQRRFWGFGLLEAVHFSLYFAVGAACFTFVDLLKARRSLFVGAGLLSIVAGAALSLRILVTLGFAVVLVCAGTLSSDAVRRLRTWGDPSYGTYIYAFLIQQVLVQQGWATTPVSNFLVAAPLSLLAGYASWHLVEHPVLRWAKGPGPVRTLREPAAGASPA